MQAKPPILDDRALKEILNRLQALARTQTPEWTPRPEGDAGTMLQRIFARLMELALQRLNEVPEKNLLAFLDAMGVSLLAPAAARAPLTFALTPGTPPTFVPRASQAVTKPGAQQPAVIFETESDLTVIPAQLATGFTIDPVWDRYTDQTIALTGQQSFGFTPFVGTKRMPHILYLGDSSLLDVSSLKINPGGEIINNLRLSFTWRSSHTEDEVRHFIQGLSFQVGLSGPVQEFFGVGRDVSGNQVFISFAIFTPVVAEMIRGVGLEQGLVARWLRIVLDNSILDDPVATDLRISNLKLEAEGRELAPDLAFSNAAPIDLSKDFFPFGNTPAVGNTFYVSNREALSKPNVRVTLHVEVKDSPAPVLMWEYWSGNTWTPLSNDIDHTNSFTIPGNISLSRPVNMALTRVNDEAGFWFRTRIASGGYRRAPRVTRFFMNTKATLKNHANVGSILICGRVGIGPLTGQPSAAVPPVADRTITIGGITFKLKTNLAVPLDDTIRCLSATINADGEIIAPSVLTTATGFIQITGIVLSFSAATQSQSGTISIQVSGKTFAIGIAAGTEVDVKENDRICLTAALSNNGQIVDPVMISAEGTSPFIVAGEVLRLQLPTTTGLGFIIVANQRFEIRPNTNIFNLEQGSYQVITITVVSGSIQRIGGAPVNEAIMKVCGHVTAPVIGNSIEISGKDFPFVGLPPAFTSALGGKQVCLGVDLEFGVIQHHLTSSITGQVPPITLNDLDFAAAGAILRFDYNQAVPFPAFNEAPDGNRIDPSFVSSPLPEFAQVLRAGPDSYIITPRLRRTHEQGSPVSHQGITLPIATLLNAVTFFVNDPSSFRRLVVTATEEISIGDVLMIDDPRNREFVIVKEVQSVELSSTTFALSAADIAPLAQAETQSFLLSPTSMTFGITTEENMLFNHASNISLRRVTNKYFLGFADGREIDLTTEDAMLDFPVFGKKPGTGNIFYFGTSTGFPPRINIDVAVGQGPPEIDLQWEFLSPNGWKPLPTFLDDETESFTRSGDIIFPAKNNPANPADSYREGEVNGQSNFWIRSRITGGDYGLPTEFEAVDASDPTKGFRIKPGTGNLDPPIITSLTLSYVAERAPAVVTQNGFLYTDESAALDLATGFNPFVSVADLTPDRYADAEPTFYLGFDAAFPEEPATLYVDAAPRAFAGSVIRETRSAPAPSSLLPPLLWEYFNGTAWRSLNVFDETNNLVESGTVAFLTPTDIAPLAKFDLTASYWIRARSSKNDPFDTQKLVGVFLNTVPAIQAITVENEILGSSNGQPNQRLGFPRTPILPGQQLVVREPEPPSDKELAAIEKEEGEDAVQERANNVTGQIETLVRWHEIDTFLLSGPHSRHYTLDHTTGEITFGDGKRGLIPPQGSNNILATYRAGGGPEGNAPKAAIVQVKSSLPGVGGVTNPAVADGGAAAETIPMVEERGPQTIKHRHHAVAGSDLEYLARQAAGTRVARAKCLSNVNRDLRFEPGWVTLIIVPDGTEAKLSPSSELIREVEDYIGLRDFIGLARQTPARVNVIGPGYIRVAVRAEVVPQDINRSEQVKKQALTATEAFLHPLTGGPNKSGWEFGRDVYASEVYQIIEGVPGVNHVESLRLLPNIAQHRLTFAPAPATVMELPEGSSVMIDSRQKAALLAEPVPPGSNLERIAIKGFKEGDRITKVLDLKVRPAQLNRTPTSSNLITIDPAFNPAGNFPRGSLLTTFDGTRRARLQQGIASFETVTEIEVDDSAFVSGLNPGEVLTVFYPFPMTVASVTLEVMTGTVQAVSASQITVALFNRVPGFFLAGCLVTTSDSTKSTRVEREILHNETGLAQIIVEDLSFAASLRSGDLIDFHLPRQTVGIEPYEAEARFPAGTVLATLDNRIRLPLLALIPANQTVTSVRLVDFLGGEGVTVSRRDKRIELARLTIQGVEPVGDIVYLDDNILVYSGAHRITMVGDPTS